MKKIYACLLGEWVCLNDDPECKFLGEGLSPSAWFEENAPIYSPRIRNQENSFYDLDYVNIFYKGKTYRINPVFIQIVHE